MRIAVAGLGFMGSTHLKALRQIPSAEVVAVVSADPRKRAGDLTSIQGNLGGPGERFDFSRIKACQSLREILRDPEVEAVDLCLPTDVHAPAALACLRAGKHVLVEKPLALDENSARELVGEAERLGRTLMVAHVLRFLPEYRSTTGMLSTGRLGPVRSAIFRRRCAAPAWSSWLGDAERSGGGVFDLLIHDVDYMLHVFGNPVSVAASGYGDLSHGIDLIWAEFRFASHAPVIISGGWHHPKNYPFSMEFTIVSETGTLEYSSAGRPLTLYRDDGVEEPVAVADRDGFEEEIRYFIDCATRGVRPDFCPPEESAQAVALTRYMLESRDRDGAPVECAR